MATNPLFEFHSQDDEQDLAADLIAESIQCTGFNLYYIPRVQDNLDILFGEDETSHFREAFEMELYLKTTGGFGNTPDTVTFMEGLTIQDEAIFTVSRLVWPDRVGSSLERPREGDLLYWPLTKTLFEVKFVQDDVPFFHLGKRYTWDMTVQMFKYSHEKIRTGIPEIDDIENRYTSSAEIELSGISGTFSANEMVYQGSNIADTTFAAEVIALTGTTLKVKHFKGVLKNDVDLITEAGASANVDSSTFDESGSSTNEQLQDNKEIQDEADTVVEWSPSNPLGEIKK